MALDKFKLNLKTLPTHPIDFNIICAASYAEYQVIKTIVGALLLPVAFLHSAIQAAIDLLNDETYKKIKKILNDLNAAMKDILNTPIKNLRNLSEDLGAFGNALAHTCEYFMSTLPDSMFNIFQDLQYGIADIVKGLVAMPDALTNSFTKSLMDFKLEAMKGLLEALYETILQPVLAYESFLKENDIIKLLDQMRKMEICMMKPGICHRSPVNFTEPVSHKSWSEYYRTNFFLTSSGNINFKLMTQDGLGAKRMKTIHSNAMAFINY